MFEYKNFMCSRKIIAFFSMKKVENFQKSIINKSIYIHIIF